jgi:hypothetical protein
MRATIAVSAALCLVLALSAQAFGDETVQTDWAGGGGVLGPVTQWGNLFSTAQGIDWASPPGALALLSALPYPHSVTSSYGEPACVDAGDLDGDRDPDLVGAAYQGGAVAWWENDGSGGGWVEHTIATGFGGAASVHVADIDADGDADVAATAEGSHTVAWWENDGAGGGWTAHIVDATASGPYCVCSADFDGDLDLDLCGALFYPADIVWWENTDGAGTAWVKHTIDPSFIGAWWTVAVDIDADTDLDIVGAGFGAGDVCWWENGGNGSTWTKHIICDSFPHALNVRAADMDGDGDPDAVGASNDGRLAWWENDGPTGTWAEHPVDEGLAGPFSARVADLDGDLDADVISNERNGDRVMWYENVAAGTSWLRHPVDETSDGPNDVLAADVDGDGAQEVIASFSWDNSVLWYEPVSECVTAGSLDSSVLDSGGPVEGWGSITWNCTTPAGTSVSVEVRASNDSGNLGAWSEVAASGDDLSAYVADGTRYFQYRISLATANASTSPGVDEIRVAYDSSTDVGEGDSGQVRFPSCGMLNSPSRSDAATIRFTIPSECAIELSIYDASGRMLETVAKGTYPAGVHAATVRGLLNGIYLYSLRAGEFRGAGKMVVTP